MVIKINNDRDIQKAIDYLLKLNLQKQYDISINLRKKIRTLPMNRLYWMWINCISKETGNEQNDLHEYFGNEWLPKIEVTLFNKQTVVKPISTTKLNTIQFKEYLDKVQVFASSELGLILPNPDDQYFDSMVDYYSNHF